MKNDKTDKNIYLVLFFVCSQLVLTLGYHHGKSFFLSF